MRKKQKDTEKSRVQWNEDDNNIGLCRSTIPGKRDCKLSSQPSRHTTCCHSSYETKQTKQTKRDATNDTTDTADTSSNSNEDSSSSNDNPPLIEEKPGYWESEDAVRLFQPAPGNSVKATLEKRVVVLKSVRDDWEALGEIVKRVRRCSKRACKYMLAYLCIQQESSLPQATVTHDHIKTLVDGCFKPNPDQLPKDNDAKNNKRKRKVKKSVKIEAEDKEKLDAVLTYSRGRGSKLDESIVSKGNKRNRITQAEETINLDVQMRTHRSHRSALDTDTSFINAEADDCELEDIVVE
jgi:hypothetical protein